MTKRLGLKEMEHIHINNPQKWKQRCISASAAVMNPVLLVIINVINHQNVI